MNKNELLEAIADKTDSSKAEAERAVRALQEVISETLQKGESITWPGFGTFEVRERGERTGRNPKTGEKLKIAASKGCRIQTWGNTKSCCERRKVES